MKAHTSALAPASANPSPPVRKASPVVVLQARAQKAWGLSPQDVVAAPAGTVLVAGDGTPLVVREDGGLDPVHSFGHRSIASDPTAVVRNAGRQPVRPAAEASDGR